MKKLTLDETWRLCLSMWRWIAKQKRNNSRKNVGVLKFLWLREHGYGEANLDCNCFFCEYIEQRRLMCRNHCPGAKVDKKFKCDNLAYDFDRSPIAFYNKLFSLNRKRLAKRK